MLEIETPRLLLRPLDTGDLQPVSGIFADPGVTRYLAVDKFDSLDAARQFAADFIRKSREEFDTSSTGAMAMIARAAGATVGYCGLRPMPDDAATVELLYALNPRHWGLGLASEAARASLNWGFDNLPISDVIGLSMAANKASCRVMEKLGMVYAGETDDHYDCTLALYRISRSHWPATA